MRNATLQLHAGPDINTGASHRYSRISDPTNEGPERSVADLKEGGRGIGGRLRAECIYYTVSNFAEPGRNPVPARGCSVLLITRSRTSTRGSASMCGGDR